MTTALLFPASYKHRRIMFPTSRYSRFYCFVVLLTSLHQAESWVPSSFGNTVPLQRGDESLLLQSFGEQESKPTTKANDDIFLHYTGSPTCEGYVCDSAAVSRFNHSFSPLDFVGSLTDLKLAVQPDSAQISELSALEMSQMCMSHSPSYFVANSCDPHIVNPPSSSLEEQFFDHHFDR